MFQNNVDKLSFVCMIIDISSPSEYNITYVSFKEDIMKRLPQISEAEYQVMKVVWNHTPVNTNQVVEYLSHTSKWNPKTIQTMLLRLVKKGALAKEKDGRVFVYTPLVLEDEYRTGVSHAFLKQFYNGALGSMVLNFIQQDQLSQEEIHQLKEILDRKDSTHD